MNDKKPSLLRRLLDRVFPRAPDFYRLLNQQCDMAVEAMQTFAEFVRDSDSEKGARVRELEHEGDDLKRRNMDELNQSFSTPMDREDILRAVVSIDDIIDYAKTTVREMEILEVTSDPPMQQMAALLLEGTLALQRGYAKLDSKPPDAEADAQHAHKTERRVEKVYRSAVAELFDEQRIAGLADSAGREAVPAALTAVLRMLRRRELYRHLSNAADRVEIAAEILHDIIVKIA